MSSFLPKFVTPEDVRAYRGRLDPFARSFDRYLVFGADGGVYEADEPVWDEGRVQRAR